MGSICTPKGQWEPNSTYDSIENFNFIEHLINFINKLLSITPQISSTHNLLVDKHTTQWGATVDFFSMKRHLKSWNSEGKFPHDPGGRIICQLIKYLPRYLRSK